MSRADPAEQATLTTSRLRLVPLAPEHLELTVELDADPEVMRYLAHGASSRETSERAHRDRPNYVDQAAGAAQVGSQP